ncbi:MAG: amidase domain-containing protein [Clostridiaceae bacterium]
MKRRLSSIILSLFLMTFVPVNVLALENTSQKEIKQVVNSYFNMEKNSKLGFKADDKIKDAVGNDILLEESQSKFNFEIEWQKKLKYKITKYEFKLNYSNIYVRNNNAKVVFTKDESMSMDTFPGVPMEARGEKFVALLEKQVNKWKLTAIVDEESKPKEYKSIISKDINILKSSNNNISITEEASWSEKLKNIDTLYSEFKAISSNNNNNSLDILGSQGNIKPAGSSGERLGVSYLGYAASAYAQKFAKSFNTAFKNFDSQGGDCTNFVSQAIYCAGLEKDSTWTTYSAAWINVKALRNYLVGAGLVTEYPTTIGPNYLGSVIQFYNPAYADWTHSGILTYYSSNGDYTFCAHSDPVLNRPLSQVYPSKYSKIRNLQPK